MAAQKTGRIRPQKTVGMVSFNVAVSTDMMTEAVTNKFPLYGPANGIYRDYVDNIDVGDVLFKFNDTESPDQSGYGEPFHPGRDTSTVRIMAILNGQGDSKESPDSFAAKCTIMGLAEYGKMNGKERLTGVRIGIMTVRNNGPYVISTGTKVYAVPPTKQQIKDSVKNSGENAGIVKFQLHPYHPEMHKTQPKEIYACLKAGGDSTHLPSYKKHCRQLCDAHAASSMVTVIKEWPEIQKTMNLKKESTADKARLLLALFGHSEFRPDGQQNESLRDALFVPHSKTKKGMTSPYLFDRENANAVQRRVNQIQESAMGQAIESNAYFTKLVENQNLGTAMSSGLPGQDFSLFLDK